MLSNEMVLIPSVYQNDGPFLYVLNDNGSNLFSVSITPGYDNLRERPSREFLTQVAELFQKTYNSNYGVVAPKVPNV